MKMHGRTMTMAVSVIGMFLISGTLLAPDAIAQVRGRGVTPSHASAGMRGSGGVPHTSYSGVQGVKSIGGMHGYMGGGYYGHDSHHDGYSYSEAYRDVGLANAAVGLVGTLLNPYGYAAYPTVVAPPVAVVSSPGVVVGSYPYGYASSYYPYDYYGYGVPYYSVPSYYPYGYYGYGPSYYSAPYCYPCGGYGYGKSYYAPHGTGYYPDHHGSPHHNDAYGHSGSWQNGHGGGYGHSAPQQYSHSGSYGPSQNNHGSARVSTYQGQNRPSPQSVHGGGFAPGMSGSHGGGRTPQQSAAHSSGRSYRIR